MTDQTLKVELLDILSKLSSSQQDTLISFARFLVQDEDAIDEPVGEPVDIPKPENETVVLAIKRLRKTYPMINPDDLISDVSSQMSAHLLKGKSTIKVIDELEDVFKGKYSELVEQKAQANV